MFRYDANTGDYPKLGDYVQVVRSGEANDGLKGRIGGWGDLDMVIALVALDQPLADGRTIVGWPVVCLTPVVSIDGLVKQQKRSFRDTYEAIVKDNYVANASTKEPFGNLCSESVAIDKDGFTVWEGGAKRPVSDSTIVHVKVRSGIPRSPIDAAYWPQICWQWRPADDPMNKWDIVAYKVVK